MLYFDQILNKECNMKKKTKNSIKACALLALLFAGNVAKGFAKEVTGTIMF